MKKYIVILLSFGLFSLPLGALARVEPGTCSAKTDQSGCNATAGCGWDTATGKCALCPYGTYNGGIGGCKTCQKPIDATFRNGDYHFQGMTHDRECPWYITCPENEEIYHNWGNNSTCGNCSPGYYKDANSSQYWDGTTMTGDCQPKTFTIHARILLPENCGTFTGTATYTFTYTATSNIYQSFLTIKYATSSKIDSTKYDYPSAGTTFTLTPINTGGPTVKLYLTGDYLVFADGSSDFNDISFYPNGQEFNIDITLLEKNPIRVYYCPFQFTNSSVQAGTCKATTYNKCNKPMAPDLSDKTIFNHGSFPDCSKGQYANSWKLLHPSNLTSYNWAASNNPVINFGDKIILPSDTNSTYFYMAPNFTNCPSGTYNDNVTCPTECTQCVAGKYSASSGASECLPCLAGTFSASDGASKCENCPAGFTTNSGAASQDACYINTTMTFKDNNNKSVTILSAPVYYVGDQ